jgi:isochorismate synthase
MRQLWWAPVRIAETLPEPGDHRARVSAAVRKLNDPNAGLHKVVLARALRLAADGPMDAGTIVARLIDDDATASVYLCDLTPAGGAYTGTVLVGASPELLVARRGETVICRPFAGSAPRSSDPERDSASGAALAGSAKNLHEHQLVVDEMRKVLDPLCVDLQIAPTPQLSRTAAVWHLSTPITARLRDTSITSLDLAVALHPTPAVGGVPAGAAAGLIRDLEGDRGFYAGAVGWCDANGDGRWVVSIRCAQLSADRRTADARAGGGIVAESDPDDEVLETTTKFRTILSALGVQT